MSENNKIIVPNKGILAAGIDDGFRKTKIYINENMKIIIDSQARAGEQTQIVVGSGEKTIFQYDVGDRSFILGNITESDPTNFDDYPFSPMNRAIVSHALSLLGLTNGHEISAVSGLPVKTFYKGRNLNKDLINKKKKNLFMNDVLSVDYTMRGKERSNSRIPKIVKHRVLSEGVAAWMDFVIERDSSGNLIQNKDKYHQKTAFIDIGGRTTDIAVVQAGNLDFEKSTTDELGMLNIENAIREEINNEFDFTPTRIQMNELMETGQLSAYGKKHDVTGIIQSSMITESTKIKSIINSRLKKAADINSVVFVGGTSESLKPYLAGMYPHEVFAEEPEFANARGMAKFSELNLSKG